MVAGRQIVVILTFSAPHDESDPRSIITRILKRISMKKKIIVSLCVLVSMSCLLGMFTFLMDTWGERNFLRNGVGVLALMGWVVITYRMATLKYKWIRRLAE